MSSWLADAEALLAELRQNPRGLDEIVASLGLQQAERFMPHMLCAHSRNWLRHNGRYGIITYENPIELYEIQHYLERFDRDARRERGQKPRGRHEPLVHPFGDVDAFALLYRNVPAADAYQPWRHVWNIPRRLISKDKANARLVIIDTLEYADFYIKLSEENTSRTLKLGWFTDDEFAADVRELGHTRVVFHKSEHDDRFTHFTLESHAPADDPDWMTRWTLLKLRWT